MLAIAAAQSTSTAASGLARMRSSPSGTMISVVTPRQSVVPWPQGRVRASSAVANQLLSVRRAFSLTMQQLATALGVTRPMVYRWRDGEVAPRRKHLERVASLARIAQQWIALGGEPLGLSLHAPSSLGPSFFELICTEPIPLSDVSQVLREIATAQAPRRLGHEIPLTRSTAGRARSLRSDAEVAAEDAVLTLSSSREAPRRA